MKKALSLFLALIMVVGIIPTTAIGIFAEDTTAQQGSTTEENSTESGDGTSTESTIPEDAVAISTAAELLAIDGTESGKYYYLTADIDLGTGEGDAYAVTAYSSAQITLNGSTLDGCGHKITGFKLVGDGADLGFMNIQGACTIKNLIIGENGTPIEFDMDNSASYCAIITSNVTTSASLTMTDVDVYANMHTTVARTRVIGVMMSRAYGRVTMTDCNVYGTISDTQTSNQGVAGFIGETVKGSTVRLTSCVNNVNVTGFGKLSGFIGASDSMDVAFEDCVNKGDITGANTLIGGFLGQHWASGAYTTGYSFINCTNEGAINGKGAIGGIVGELNSNSHTANGTIVMKNLTNNGTVTATAGRAGGIMANALVKMDALTIENLVNNNTVSATDYAGGVFGYIEISANDLVATSCGNTGAVSSSGANSGGIIGQIATNNKNITFNGCYNNGSVTSTGSGKNVGGLIGYLNTNGKVSVNKYSNRGAIEATNCAGGMFGCVDNTGDMIVTDAVNYGSSNGSGNTGGLIGFLKNSNGAVNITNSKNFGSATSKEFAGGFVGRLTNETGGAITISSVKNYGSVESTNKKCAGGIIGFLPFKVSSTISKVENYGAIKTNTTTDSNEYAGGVIGYVCDETTDNSCTLTIEDVLNMGTVTAGKKAAAVVAYFGDGTLVLNRAIHLGETVSGWASVGALGAAEAAANVTVTNCINAGTTKTASGYYPIFYHHNTDAEILATNNNLGTTNVHLAGVYTSTNNATELADLDAVIAHLNTGDTYKSVWGPFKAGAVNENEKATSIVQATPTAYGLQIGTYKTADGEELDAIRFVGTIKNTLRYKEIGYTVTVGENTADLSCEYVYETITAMDGTTQIDYTAAELGGTYIFAVAVPIPVQGEHTITVKPYAIDTDGTEYRDTQGFVVTLVDGAVFSIVKA